MNIKDVVLPDFRTWAENTKLHTKQQELTEIEMALKQAFEQGWTLGYRNGKDHGWEEEADKQYYTEISERLLNKE